MFKDYIIDYLQKIRLVLVMGKGGVGKTSISAGLAELASQNGLKTLIATVDPAHRLNDWYSQKIGHEPTKMTETLDAIMIDHKAVLDELVASYSKDPNVLKQIKESPLYDIVGRGLPGLPESMAIWKIKHLLDKSKSGELPYQLIIVDLPPKGQGEHFLNLSDTIQRALDTVSIAQLHMQLYDFSQTIGSTVKNFYHMISGNSERQQPFYITRFVTELKRNAEEVEKIFKDPAITIFNIVLHAEKPVINESLELYHTVRTLGIPLGFFIANRIEPGLGTEALLQLKNLEKKGEVEGLLKKAAELEAEKLVATMLSQARHRENLRNAQLQRITQLKKKVQDFPFFLIPEFPQNDALPTNRPIFGEHLSKKSYRITDTTEPDGS